MLKNNKQKFVLHTIFLLISLILLSNISLAKLNSYSPEINNKEEILSLDMITENIDDGILIYNSIITDANFENVNFGNGKLYFYVPKKPYKYVDFDFVLLFVNENKSNIDVNILNKNVPLEFDLTTGYVDKTKETFFALYFFKDNVDEEIVNYILSIDNKLTNELQTIPLTLETKENLVIETQLDHFTQNQTFDYNLSDLDELLNLLEKENFNFSKQELLNKISEANNDFELSTDVFLINQSFESKDVRTISRIILNINKKEINDENFIYKNIYLIHKIPKEYSNNTKSVDFEIVPMKILKEDPLIMWQIADVEMANKFTFEKETNSKITGETILIYDKESSKENFLSKTWMKIILPLLLIPFIAVLLIYFSRFSSKIK
jgi:hypothetical protein